MKVAQKRNAARVGGSSAGFAKDTVPLYKEAMVSFNWATGQSRTRRDDINLHSYITLMQMDEDNVNF
eukprot:14413402-Heterocapsa_arctica.AAC.1